MRRIGAWVGFALTASLACIRPQAFPCEEDDQCELDGAKGVCVEPGFCAYPDDDCDSGRRFEPNADEVAGECVEPGGDTDTGGADACVPMTAVAAGQAHTCSLDGEGEVWCWGSNTLGALGGPITSFMVEPTRVEGLPAIESISVSGHTCVLDVDRALWCWGDNQFGQVDWDSNAVRIEEPLQLDLGVEVESFAAGVTATCASSGGEVVCWGTVLGQRVTPTIIPGVDEPLVQMVAGTSHACGRTADGRAACWGEDNLGQLGDGGGMGTGAAVEVAFLEEGRVVDLAADADHTCALFENDAGQSVFCWGSNTQGQLGLMIESPIPQPHTAVGSFIEGAFQSVAAGVAHSCVLTGDGELHCWGNNDFGQGNFDTTSTWVEGPNLVTPPFEAMPAPVAVSAGAAHTCLLREGGVVDCWGCNMWGQLGTEPRTCEGEDIVTGRVCAVP